MPEMWSSTLKETVLLPDVVVDETINLYLRLSLQYLIPATGLLPEVQLMDKCMPRNSSYAYNPSLRKEIFDYFATEEAKQKLSENQEPIHTALAEHATELSTYGVYIPGLRMRQLDQVFKIGNFGNGEAPWAFIKWLSTYDKKEQLPDYDSFYLFHLPNIALNILKSNNSIDDKTSLGNAIMNAVNRDSTIQYDATTGRSGETSVNGNVYATQLDAYSNEQQKKLIAQILQLRKKRSDNKIKSNQIKGHNVKMPSGLKVVVAEAFPNRPARGDRCESGGKVKSPQKPKPWSFPKK